MTEEPRKGPPAPHTLGQWVLVGLVPALIHGLVLSGMTARTPNDDLLIWLLGMPVFALVYLIAIVAAFPALRIAGGRTLSKRLYLLGMLALNALLWVGGCALKALELD